ncbi:hypothetical protein B0H12DRAFT_1069913 [Mycena haematopus]|nr:hypothetical protein B0H12DRAFT_1069913 [Mycena haematopus]
MEPDDVCGSKDIQDQFTELVAQEWSRLTSPALQQIAADVDEAWLSVEANALTMETYHDNMESRIDNTNTRLTQLEKEKICFDDRVTYLETEVHRWTQSHQSDSGFELTPKLDSELASEDQSTGRSTLDSELAIVETSAGRSTLDFDLAIVESSDQHSHSSPPIASDLPNSATQSLSEDKGYGSTNHESQFACDVLSSRFYPADSPSQSAEDQFDGRSPLDSELAIVNTSAGRSTLDSEFPIVESSDQRSHSSPHIPSDFTDSAAQSLSEDEGCGGTNDESQLACDVLSSRFYAADSPSQSAEDQSTGRSILDSELATVEMDSFLSPLETYLQEYDTVSGEPRCTESDTGAIPSDLHGALGQSLSEDEGYGGTNHESDFRADDEESADRSTLSAEDQFDGRSPLDSVLAIADTSAGRSTLGSELTIVETSDLHPHLSLPIASHLLDNPAQSLSEDDIQDYSANLESEFSAEDQSAGRSTLDSQLATSTVEIESSDLNSYSSPTKSPPQTYSSDSIILSTQEFGLHIQDRCMPGAFPDSTRAKLSGLVGVISQYPVSAIWSSSDFFRSKQWKKLNRWMWKGDHWKQHSIKTTVIVLFMALLLPFALGLVFPSLTSPLLIHVFSRDNKRLRVVRAIRDSNKKGLQNN